MQSKEYKMSDGRTAIFEYGICEVGKITLESMDMLMGELIAYKRCVQSRSYLDAKHCDGCRFYDDCPFNPREVEDEPQTEDKCKGCIYENDKSLMACVSCQGKVPYDGYDFMDEMDEPQTDCSWK